MKQIEPRRFGAHRLGDNGHGFSQVASVSSVADTHANPWDFVRGNQRLAALPVTGRLIVNDAQTYVEACTAGPGVAQLLQLGIGPLPKAGKLVDLSPDWSDDYFPLWAYYPSRQFASSKLHALLDFLKSPKGDDVGIRKS